MSDVQLAYHVLSLATRQALASDTYPGMPNSGLRSYKNRKRIGAAAMGTVRLRRTRGGMLGLLRFKIDVWHVATSLVMRDALLLSMGLPRYVSRCPDRAALT